MKHTLTTLLLSLGLAASAQAEWQFGLGGGLGAFDIDGEIEANGGAADFEYDTGDLEAAFGLNGYAANGNWIIKSSISYLEVEADQDIGNPQKDKVNFERLIFDLTAGYTFYNENDWKLTGFGGLRYVDFQVDGNALGDAEDDWTDAVIGATASYQFAEKWAWVSSLEATFGDSEGTYGVSTGVNWAFAEKWTASATLTWKTWEYDGDDSNVAAGDYTYDADEIKLGLGIMYHF